MLSNRGDTFVKGIDVIIKRDLDKHKSLLEKNNLDIQAFQTAIASEIGRKRFYGEQKGNRRYRDEDMDRAIEQMNKNIAHLSIRIKLAEDLRVQNTLIVDTLTEQLKQYNLGMKELTKRHIYGNNN